MALQVWLPLTKDTRNQGLASGTITWTTAASFTNNGKLGKALTTGGCKMPASMTSQVLNNTAVSIACWLYVNADADDSTNRAMIFGNDSMSALGGRQFSIFRYPNSDDIHLSWQNYSGGTYSGAVVGGVWSGVLTPRAWNHVCVTYQNPNVKIYVNGIQIGSTSGVINADSFAYDTQIIWNSTSHYINDFRLYDHCLSPMEVKELSKGLVLHYPLNRGGLGPSNLITNGFGELGSENWTSSTSISTTDIPSGQSDIKASFSGYTIEHINIYPSHTYKFSAWIKATATSGNTYPSLYPYDVDGKFINNYNCPVGFNLNTMTTLKQQLTTGDTKIYVNDLSQWNANSGHYYDVAAIFSYTDGTGYTYPDGTYTQNCPAFGTGTNEKTNLDKTNNIITLNSAYTGPTMPVGTKLCASTYGSTYFYPLGGINLTTIADWTYKEGTFSGDHGRLRYAKTVTFWTYSSNRMAGIKLQDITSENFDSTTEYDCSGYCNNGTKMTDTITYASDTAKYQVSTHFNGTYDGILIENLQLSDIINSAITYAFWIKPEGESGARSVYFGSYSGNSWSIEKTTGNLVRLYWNGSPDETCSGATITDGVWQHVCITKSGTSDVKVYINGVQKWSSTAAHNNLSFPTTYRLGRDVRSNDGTPYKGLMSDFRIYATALSTNDVKALYQNSAYIDSSGNVYGAVYSEV